MVSRNRRSRWPPAAAVRPGRTSRRYRPLLWRVCGRFRGAHEAADILIFVLQAIQIPVDTPLGQELLVGARLAKLALVHHEDPIGSLDGRKPVGDDDRRAALK